MTRVTEAEGENEYFEKISLAPKLCEMYATILLKLFLNFHQHIIEEVNATVELIKIIVVSELVANLNISEGKRVVRDIQIVLYGTL